MNLRLSVSENEGSASENESDACDAEFLHIPTASAPADSVLNTSRSEEKLSNFSDLRSSESLPSGYDIFHSSFLTSLLKMLCCKFCHGTELLLNVIKKNGLAFLYSLQCPLVTKTYGVNGLHLKCPQDVVTSTLEQSSL